MKTCKKCLMPNTRPNTLFGKDNICQACKNYDTRENVDWRERWKELELICNKFRNPYVYDVVAPVSGGKDSHTIVYILKECLGMKYLSKLFLSLLRWV